MSTTPHRRRTAPRTKRTALAVAGVMVAGLIPALAATGTAAAAPRAGRQQGRLTASGPQLSLRVPATQGAPGYRLDIQRSPFQLTTVRGSHTVLATTDGAIGFRTATGQASATAVTDARWHDGVLDLTLATTAPATRCDYRITPRRRPVPGELVRSTAAPPADQVATHYDVASAGHWYGQGEAQTPDGGPYTRQPWPLDSGTVHDDAMGPAEYLMTDPFWFTQRGTGLWVDTRDVMDVSMNARPAGRLRLHPHRRHRDGRHGVRRAHRPRRLPRLHRHRRHAGQERRDRARNTPSRCGTRGRSTTRRLAGVGARTRRKGLHDAGMPGHTIQIDDGWSTHYGDFDFNSKFPDPKAAVARRSTRWATTSASGSRCGSTTTRTTTPTPPARLPAEVQDRPEQAVQRHVVERHGGHRRPRQPGRRAWYVAQLHEPGADLRRRRLQVRHPVLRRVLRAVPRLLTRWTTSSSAPS